MIQISLSCGQTVLIDDQDYDLVKGYRWRKQSTGSSQTYASVSTKVKGKTVLMHRLIMGAQPGELIDHRNGNTFDNRRSNLRVASYSLNGYNCKIYANNNSGYRGVSRGRRPGLWFARMTHLGQSIHIGTFDCPIDAAMAFDKRALELRGETARLNFPDALQEVAA